MERIILSAGGTGGHIFPALAVAESIKAEYPEARILFVGSSTGPEAVLAARAGLEFSGLAVRGFLGRGFKAVGAGVSMLSAIVKACRIVDEFNPDMVVGFGGYASFAPVIAARLMDRACAVHEQNALGGLSNKILGRMADRVFLSMPETIGFDGLKAIFTGNPVRGAVAVAGREEHGGNTRRLLVFGGSQGARTINNFMINALPLLIKNDVEIRHQTGSFDYERVQKYYREAGASDDSVFSFIEDMAGAYAWSDMVLCRSGATTVAELAAAGKAAILAPFPHATHDHQTFNARAMEKLGAAMLVPDTDLQKDGTAGTVMRLLEDKEKLRAMGRAALAAARPEAALNVVRAMEDIIEAKEKNAR